MKIIEYTATFTGNEMWELADALEEAIEAGILPSIETKHDHLLNDQKGKLDLLQVFVENGHSLTVSKRVEGKNNLYHWESHPKEYDDTEEWFKALLKQRRLEFKQNENEKV